MIPLYEFRCSTHGVSEHIIKHRDLERVEVICSDCGAVMDRLRSAPAKTATLWHGGWTSGLTGSGFHSASAGIRVANKREEEKVMQARGYINEKDLGGESFYEKMTTKGREERQRLDNIADSYITNLNKFDGDKMKAVEHTFPAHQMLEEAYIRDEKGVAT